jgi:hypothetical protein
MLPILIWCEETKAGLGVRDADKKAAVLREYLAGAPGPMSEQAGRSRAKRAFMRGRMKLQHPK